MKTIKFENLQNLIGEEIGISNWTQVSQKQINSFADCTDDHQFIHVDEKRAKNESPFDGTIAHGFLSLSLLTKFANEVVFENEENKIVINYGFNKIRFILPVKEGKKIRARFHLSDIIKRKPGQTLITYKVTIEIKNEEKPALIAEWLIMQLNMQA